VDALKETLDVLRALARQSSDQNVYILAEQHIGRYLQSPGAMLGNLEEAIAGEARAAQNDVQFWKTMQEFLARAGVERRSG
jgi:hypothetical protein